MTAATIAAAITASAVVILMSPSGLNWLLDQLLEVRDEPGKLGIGDAAELLGSEKVVDLVSADVEHFGYLLNGVGLHLVFTSPPRSGAPGWRVRRYWRPRGLDLCSCMCTLRGALNVQTRARGCTCTST